MTSLAQSEEVERSMSRSDFSERTFSEQREGVYVYNENIVLQKLYEDDELIVVVAPNEDQLRDIIVKLLREKPLTVKELHSILSGLASEDKIRHALSQLMEEGLVYSDKEGRYFLVASY